MPGRLQHHLPSGIRDPPSIPVLKGITAGSPMLLAYDIPKSPSVGAMSGTSFVCPMGGCVAALPPAIQGHAAHPSTRAVCQSPTAFPNKSLKPHSANLSKKLVKKQVPAQLKQSTETLSVQGPSAEEAKFLG